MRQEDATQQAGGISREGNREKISLLLLRTSTPKEARPGEETNDGQRVAKGIAIWMELRSSGLPEVVRDTVKRVRVLKS